MVRQSLIRVGMVCATIAMQFPDTTLTTPGNTAAPTTCYHAREALQSSSPAPAPQQTALSKPQAPQTPASSQSEETISDLATRLGYHIKEACKEKTLSWTSYVCSRDFWQPIGEYCTSYMTWDFGKAALIGFAGSHIWHRYVWLPWLHRNYIETLAKESEALPNIRLLTWVDVDQLKISDRDTLKTALDNIYKGITTNEDPAQLKDVKDINCSPEKSWQEIADDFEEVHAWLQHNYTTISAEDMLGAKANDVLSHTKALRIQAQNNAESYINASQFLSRWYNRINDWINRYTGGLATINRIGVAALVYYSSDIYHAVRQYTPTHAHNA